MFCGYFSANITIDHCLKFQFFKFDLVTFLFTFINLGISSSLYSKANPRWGYQHTFWFVLKNMSCKLYDKKIGLLSSALQFKYSSLFFDLLRGPRMAGDLLVGPDRPIQYYILQCSWGFELGMAAPKASALSTRPFTHCLTTLLYAQCLKA